MKPRLNVFPAFATQDRIHCCLVDSKASSEHYGVKYGVVWNIQGPNLQNFPLCQNGCGVSFTPGASVFSHHISHVVLGGPKKQVNRVAANPVIATMQDINQGRDWPSCERVSNPVRSLFCAATIEKTIPPVIGLTSKSPALINPTDLNLAPKAVNLFLVENRNWVWQHLSSMIRYDGVSI